MYIYFWRISPVLQVYFSWIILILRTCFFKYQRKTFFSGDLVPRRLFIVMNVCPQGRFDLRMFGHWTFCTRRRFVPRDVFSFRTICPRDVWSWDVFTPRTFLPLGRFFLYVLSQDVDVLSQEVFLCILCTAHQKLSVKEGQKNWEVQKKNREKIQACRGKDEARKWERHKYWFLLSRGEVSFSKWWRK